jgi:hypothetical protein
MKIITSVLTAALSLLSGTMQAQYSIDWFKIAGGGGASTSGVYAVSGTIGQPEAGGPTTNGQYCVTGGFWTLPGAVQMPGAPTLYITNAAPGFATIWWTPATPPASRCNSATAFRLQTGPAPRMAQTTLPRSPPRCRGSFFACSNPDLESQI